MVNATPRPLYPRERDRLPLAQEPGWPPRAGLDGCGISPHPPTPGFDPWIVQPISSRYTDYRIKIIAVNYMTKLNVMTAGCRTTN